MMRNRSNSSCRGRGGGDGWPRVCDACRSAASTVYCRADSAYLCTGCDARIHGANKVASRHERVFLCESCERAPAAFICKADSASLCVSCDAEIHSANPLAHRHHRVPVLPMTSSFYASEMMGSTAGSEDQILAETIEELDDEDEAVSWLLFNPAAKNNNNNGLLYNGAVDEYLDLLDYSDNQFSDEKYNGQQQQNGVPQKNYGGDSIVPEQFGENKDQFREKNQNFQLGMIGYESSKASYNYNSSVHHSVAKQVSVLSMDVGIVPESTTSEVSISHSRPPKGTTDIFSGSAVPMVAALSPVDREARVLRYREKKKTRKFEKTIRYASRKAYAETRPRIKGRFAKRETDVEVEVDQLFSSSPMAEIGYGIVPSF